MAGRSGPRCTIRQKLAKAATDSLDASFAAKTAFAVALRRQDSDSVAAAAALKAARDALREAENALRDHIEKHGCTW